MHDGTALEQAYLRQHQQRSQWVLLPSTGCIGAHADAHGPILYEPITVEQLDAVYGPCGALRGKKRLAHVFARIKGEQQYQVLPIGDLVPRPRHRAREKMFWLALVHTLGFPEPDGFYPDLKLRFFYHRAPHAHTSEEGVYTIEVVSTTKQGKPLSLSCMYARTAWAVSEALQRRREQHEGGDFSRMSLRVGESADWNHGYVPADLSLTMQIKAELRGAALLHEITLQGKNPKQKQEDVIPTGLQLTGQALHVSSGSSSAYERYWRGVLEGYDPEQHFTDRVERIDRDLAVHV